MEWMVDDVRFLLNDAPSTNEVISQIKSTIPVLCDKYEWIPRFLLNLRETCNVKLSCERAGVSRARVYMVRNQFEAFARAWRLAEEDASDDLAFALRERGIAVSDKAAIFLLQAHQPEKYREQKPETKIVIIRLEIGGQSRDITSLDDLTTDELRQLERGVRSGSVTIDGDATLLLGEAEDTIEGEFTEGGEDAA